jgi:hypothetical protein
MNPIIDDSLIELLDSLSVYNPKKTYVVGSKFADIIYLKYEKRNIKIKSFDELLNIMETLIKKSSSDLVKIVDAVSDEDIPVENNYDISIVNKQRWINFKKMCKLCK